MFCVPFVSSTIWAISFPIDLSLFKSFPLICTEIPLPPSALISILDSCTSTSQSNFFVFFRISFLISLFVCFFFSFNKTYILDWSSFEDPPDVIEEIPEEPEDIIPATLSTSLISFTFFITVSVIDAVSSIEDPCGILIVIVICVLSMLGIKELPIFIAPKILPANSASVTATTMILRFNNLVITLRYNVCSLLITLLSFCVTLLSTPADIIGTNVTATIRLATRE